MAHPPENLQPALADLLLAVADDKLMLGHRNSDWTGLAPILEEDIAFSSLAQDDLAHAQVVYELAATVDRGCPARRIRRFARDAGNDAVLHEHVGAAQRCAARAVWPSR